MVAKPTAAATLADYDSYFEGGDELADAVTVAWGTKDRVLFLSRQHPRPTSPVQCETRHLGWRRAHTSVRSSRTCHRDHPTRNGYSRLRQQTDQPHRPAVLLDGVHHPEPRRSRPRRRHTRALWFAISKPREPSPSSASATSGRLSSTSGPCRGSTWMRRHVVRPSPARARCPDPQGGTIRGSPSSLHG